MRTAVATSSQVQALAGPWKQPPTRRSAGNSASRSVRDCSVRSYNGHAVLNNLARASFHTDLVMGSQPAPVTVPRPAPTIPTPSAPVTGLEVIWTPGMSPEQVCVALQSLAQRQRQAVALRVEPDVAAAVQNILIDVDYNASARALLFRGPAASELPKVPRVAGAIAIVTATGGDASVADECKLVAEQLGCYAYKVTDMSSAGIDKVINSVSAIAAADVIVVVSGLEMALPSLVAGLVDAPVVAVPTTMGSRAALDNLTTLLAAIATAAPGVNVTPLNSGYNGAMAAARMLKMASKLHAKRTGAATANDGTETATAA